VARLKEHIERYQEDMKNLTCREHIAADKAKKTERQLREAKDELSRLTLKECEAQGRKVNLEKQLESSDMEISTLKVSGELKYSDK
jgi:myosin-18